MYYYSIIIVKFSCFNYFVVPLRALGVPASGLKCKIRLP